MDAVIRPLPFVVAPREPLTLDPRRARPGPTFFEQLDVPARGAAAGGDLAVDLQLGGARGRAVVPFETIEEGAAQLGDPRAHVPLLGRHRRRRSPIRAVEPRVRRRRPGGARRARPRCGTRSSSSPPITGRSSRPRSTSSTRSGRRSPSTRTRAGGLGARLLPPRRATGDRRGRARERLGERAEVRLAAELFPDAGPAAAARLADVCVLPAPGRMAWLQAYPSRQLRFKGHHGGLTPEEAETWVGIMQA